MTRFFPPAPGRCFRRYTPAEKATVCAYAQRTSQHRAAERFGVHQTTVGCWLRHLGLPRRRVGNYTRAELEALPC